MWWCIYREILRWEKEFSEWTWRRMTRGKFLMLFIYYHIASQIPRRYSMFTQPLSQACTMTKREMPWGRIGQHLIGPLPSSFLIYILPFHTTELTHTKYTLIDTNKYNLVSHVHLLWNQLLFRVSKLCRYTYRNQNLIIMHKALVHSLRNGEKFWIFFLCNMLIWNWKSTEYV